MHKIRSRNGRNFRLSHVQANIELGHKTLTVIIRRGNLDDIGATEIRGQYNNRKAKATLTQSSIQRVLL